MNRFFARRTRVITVVAILALGALIYAYLSAELHLQLFSKFPRDQVGLTVWSPAENATAFKTISDAYHAKHPNVKVTLLQRDPAAYASDLSSVLGGSGGPDIVAIRNGLLPKYRTSLSPASRNLSVDAVEQSFVPAVSSDFATDGKVYGLPLGVSDLMLYYHKDALNKAGLSEPKTWGDVLSDVGKLTTRNGLNISATTMAIGTSETTASSSDILQALMLQNGTMMDKRDHSAALFTQPDQQGSYFPGAKALDFYTSFSNPTKLTYNYSAAQGGDEALFQSGGAVMFVGPTTMAGKLAESVSDLGEAPLPQIDSGQSVNVADYWAYAVSHNSQNAFVAWDFIKFASSQKQALSYDSAAGLLGGRMDVLKTQSTDRLLGPAAKQAASGNASHLLTWYGLHWPETDTAFAQAINSVLASQSTPQQALTTASQTVSSALAATKTQLDSAR
jgi:ABC-type glycerol-3-phosphate transport system substrate-binding protein